MSKKKEIRFPRNLYKNGGALVWGKKEYTYSTVLVENEKEFETAIKAGYLDNFSEAIFGKPDAEPEPEADVDFKDDDF
jgi:hypothetical protein